jgi:hypothetical protein
MTSRIRCLCIALVLGGFACSDKNGSASQQTPDGGTTGTPGPCGEGALNPKKIGLVGVATALALSGSDLFFTANPDAMLGSVEGLPSFVSKLPVAGGTPVNLVSSTKGGVGLSPVRLDDENVYFFDFETRLSKVAKSGGAPATLARLDSSLPISGVEFDLDATSVYYFEGPVLTKVSKDGGVPTETYTHPQGVRTSLLDGDDVIFVGGSGVPSTDTPTLFRIPKEGGGIATRIADLTGDPKLFEMVQQLAMDGSNLVYRSVTHPAGTMTFDSAIYSVPKTGGTPIKIADGQAFAAQGGTVYFADSSTIKKVPVSGGTPVDMNVGSGSSGVDAIALDETTMYWETGGCFYKAAR